MRHSFQDRVEGVFARIDQDRRNARLIGEMVVGQVRLRLKERTTRIVSPSAEGPISMAGDRSRPRNPVTVDRWSLLSASELIDLVETLNEDELRELMNDERQGRCRAAVMDAVERRLQGESP
jgi:hypothetical protein